MNVPDHIAIPVLLLSTVLLILPLVPGAPTTPCGPAEFAPDIPQHIKEQCREQRRIKL